MPSLGGYPDEYGDLLIIAEGNNTAVGISYRATGGEAITQASIAPEGSLSIQLPAGIAPDFQITSSPLGQLCTLPVDWQFHVMPRSQTLKLDCENRFALPASLTAYPLQWVGFDGVALDSIAAELRIEFTRSGNTQVLPLVVADTQLLFSIPDNSSGNATLTLWQGSEKIADIATTIGSIPTLDPANFVDDWFSDQFGTVEQSLSASAYLAWNAQHTEQLASFKQQYAALSEPDKLVVARTLWANVTAMNEAFAASAAELNQWRAPLLSKTTLTSCISATGSLGTMVAGVGIGMAATTYVGSVLASGTGLAAPVIIIGAGIITASIPINAEPKVRQRARNAVRTCARYVLTFAPEGYAYSPQSNSLRHNLVSKPSGDEPLITRTLNLVHAQPYSTKLMAQRELPPVLVSAIRNAQTLFQPVSGFLGDSLDWLFLFDFKPTMPLNSGAQFTLTAEGISATTLSLDSSSALAIELALTADPLPSRPTPFAINATATVRDSWLDEDIPVEIAIDGHLSGLAPIAFDITYDVLPGETIEFTLPTEFATATSIITAPQVGTLAAGDAVGKYTYAAAGETEEEQDTFVYEASNYTGSAQAQVTINLLPHCEEVWEGYRMCNFDYSTDDYHLSMSVGMSNKPTDNNLCRNISRNLGVQYYKKNDDQGDSATISVGSNMNVIRCNDYTRTETVRGLDRAGSARSGSESLTTFDFTNGSFSKEHRIHQSLTVYQGVEGAITSYESCAMNDTSSGSARRSSFMGPDGPDGVKTIYDYGAESLVYCPTITHYDIAPYSIDFIINSVNVYNHGMMIFKSRGYTLE